MTKNKVSGELVGKLGSSKIEFGADGTTIVITLPDGTVKNIKKITSIEKKYYEEIGTGKYFSVFYAISRGINFYKGDFLKDVCVYSDYFGDDPRFAGGWTFYKEKE